MDEKSEKKLMTFALLIPCYNSTQFIDQFLLNISKLTLPFDEIIFYDDCSTDDTYITLKAKGFNVIKGELNKGPAFARNELAKRSTCDWLHFHDIDDGMYPDYLERTSEIAISTPSTDVILCNVDWFDSRKKNILLSWKYSNNDIKKNSVLYTIKNPIGGINGLYKKSKFIETGGFDESLRVWEDADFHVKLAARNAIFYVVENVLSFAIRYPGSLSANQSTAWLTRLKLLELYYKMFEVESIRVEIGKQAQNSASALVIAGEFDGARHAFELSELCKVKVPNNNSILWSLAKILLPVNARIKLRMYQLKKAFKKD